MFMNCHHVVTKNISFNNLDLLDSEICHNLKTFLIHLPYLSLIEQELFMAVP